MRPFQPFGKDPRDSRRTNTRRIKCPERPDRPAFTATPDRTRGGQPPAFLARGAATAAAFPTLARSWRPARSPAAPRGRRADLDLLVASPEHPVKWTSPRTTSRSPTGSPRAECDGQRLHVHRLRRPGALKSFEKKYKQYNVKCTITTFEDTTEALGDPLRAFRRTSSTPATTRWEVDQGCTHLAVEPLLHPEHLQRVPSFTNPFYDQEWRYTIPYPCTPPGSPAHRQGQRGHRRPSEPVRRPVDPQLRQELSVLDDYHTAMAWSRCATASNQHRRRQAARHITSSSPR